MPRFPVLNMSLSRVQTLVGLTAGVLSIVGALVAFLRPSPDHKGKLVAIVRDAKTDKAVTDATIEVLTATDAIVTTLRPNTSGQATCTLDEGAYRLRISHPHYASELREVRLTSTQNTEVHIQLRAGSNIVRRLFHH